MNHKLNILFLTSWYPNEEDQECGNFVQQHAYAVAEYCNVHVLTVFPREQNKEFDIKHRKISDSLSETIVFCKKRGRISHKLFPFSNFKSKQLGLQKGLDFIEDNFGAIDLVHLHVFSPAGYFALKLKRKRKISFVYTEHWTIFLPSSKVKPTILEQFLIRRIVAKASRICPVSEGLKREMKKYGHPEKYSVVPNVIDIELFSPIQSNGLNEPLRLIHISGMNEYQKNISGLFEVLKYLKEAGLNYEMLLIGASLNEGQLKMIEEYKIGHTIKNYPFLSPREVADYLKHSDLFVLTSHYETFSIVLAESIACGVPVITTNVDGVAQDITDDLGRVVETGAMREMADSIIGMVGHIPNLKANIKMKLYSEKYSARAVGKQYYDVYSSTLKKIN